MPADQPSSEPVTIAQILAIGLLEQSRRSPDQQRGLLTELTAVVGEALAASGGEPGMFQVPTPDGFLLFYPRDYLAPVECAVRAARALQGRSHLPVRMGIHVGPVHRVAGTDAGVAGRGVETVQRVMDCGEAGHILLSPAIAALLEQHREWSGVCRDLGEREVLPGVRLHLFNLVTEGAGNPAVPRRLQAPAPAPVAGHESRVTSQRRDDQDPQLATRGPRLESAPGTVLPRPRVALLYRRDAEPDVHVVQLLEARLAEYGCPVFSDRHLPIGVDWARSIQREVRRADVVVPVLSAAVRDSEMLAYELRLALETAEEQDGRPQLLPVRVGAEVDFSRPLQAILDAAPALPWTGPQDDGRLAEAVIAALQQLPASPVRAADQELAPPTGVLPLDSRFYIVRPGDDELYAALQRRDSIVRIRGARQMGKTTLLSRGLDRAREAGARVLTTDFQALNGPHLESPETLFRTLARWMAKELDLEVSPDEIWDPLQGPNWNFRHFMLREVLGSSPAPVVWGLDEVDRLFVCPFAGEVFGLFRTWHNERALNPRLPWTRLTLAMAYATEAHLFIRDLNQSPFNVGTRIPLQDFTVPEVADLNARYASPLREERETARYHQLLGGQPYLTHRGLHEMATRGLSLAELEATAAAEDGVFGDHLRRLLTLIAEDAELLDAVRAILRGAPCPSPQLFYRLWSAGVVTGSDVRRLRPRCELYATYLERHLL